MVLEGTTRDSMLLDLKEWYSIKLSEPIVGRYEKEEFRWKGNGFQGLINP